jgi:hypothetical protein
MGTHTHAPPTRPINDGLVEAVDEPSSVGPASTHVVDGRTEHHGPRTHARARDVCCNVDGRGLPDQLAIGDAIVFKRSVGENLRGVDDWSWVSCGGGGGGGDGGGERVSE